MLPNETIVQNFFMMSVASWNRVNSERTTCRPSGLTVKTSRPANSRPVLASMVGEARASLSEDGEPSKKMRGPVVMQFRLLVFFDTYRFDFSRGF